MNREITNYQARKDLADLITNNCRHFIPKTYLLTGPSGCGKKYIINKVYEDLNNRENITVLEFLDDQIICKKDKYKNKRKKFEINAALYLGISFSLDEKNNSKLNYIISSLKEIENVNIVIIQPDIENLDDIGKQILKIIVNNRSFIEQNTNKKISVLCSTEISNRAYLNNWNFDNYYLLKAYAFDDIINYLDSVLNIELNEIPNYKIKVEKLEKISNGNFNLINILYKDVLNNDIKYSDSLLKIVEFRINEIKKNCANDVVSEKDLEDIILSCSLCIHFFNKHIITCTSKKSEEKVVESLNIYDSNNIIYKNNNKYCFLSEEIKTILESQKSNSDCYVDFYNYVSTSKHDSYYERAYYLVKYYNKITPQILSLFILAISKAYSFNDTWKIDKIKEYIQKYSEQQEFIDAIKHVNNACFFMTERRYSDAVIELNKINENIYDNISRAEINRLKFRNYYLDKIDSKDCYKTIEKLKLYIQRPLKLDFNNDTNLISIDEFTLRLQIIYDIAPCIIDDYNDYDEFERLYDISLNITRKIEDNNLSTFTTKYILNVFNRKAFLFANPMVADTYYEEAKSFFYKNQILDEYCITLICYAGTLLATSEFKKALDYCNEAEQLISMREIKIPTPEKLFNNTKIAEFLNAESQNNEFTSNLKLFCENIINDLYDSSQKLSSSASKHVILTNVASLSLYSENYKLYKKAKKDIEFSLGCTDVSDINNNFINDFYRYHFAWFELFYNMQIENWEKCEELIDKIDIFIPALFKKSEKLWKKKNKPVRELIKTKTKVDGYYFCNKLVTMKNREDLYNNFYYRGLPVSDLQYTSYN